MKSACTTILATRLHNCFVNYTTSLILASHSENLWIIYGKSGASLSDLPFKKKH